LDILNSKIDVEFTNHGWSCKLFEIDEPSYV